MHRAWKKHQKHGVLDRHQLCPEERIEVLLNTIERKNSSRITPSFLYPECCSNGNWQRDLQQNNVYNPFSEKSKKMIEDMGNVELFELFETDLKTQCTECLL